MTSSNLRLPRFALLGACAPAALAVIAVISAFAGLLADPVRADDRDVLRDAAGKPYVFILLDNSGSMTRQPPCDASDIADGKCDPADFCADDLGCRLPLEGDDPKSKFRIAREAMYEVMSTVTDVDFGFATFDQNALRVKDKHWLYKVAASQPSGFFSLAGSVGFPTAGTNEIFGALLTCTGGTGDANVACMPPVGDCGGSPAARLCMPADSDDSWEMERFRRLPRLGANGNTTTEYYLRVPTGPTRYRVRFTGPGSGVTYADTGSITVDVQVATCTNNDCTSVSGPTTKSIVYDAQGEFLIHDPSLSRTGNSRTLGWLGYTDAESTATCDWEGNLDGASDLFGGYSLTWPDVDSADPWDPSVDPDDRYISCFPAGSPATSAQETFTEGDALPFDWNDSHLDELLEHLSSQRFTPADSFPDDDFGIASYFRNERLSGDTFLHYRSEADRVLVPIGNQNLGYAIRGFRQWFAGCDHGNCGSDELGWLDIAAVCDPTYACRKTFLLILTDGDVDDDSTCHPPSNPCSATASMRSQTGIQTFVVAFGRENSGQNQLNCLSANTHTQDPIYPRNKADLVAALLEIIGQVREQAAAFASAAVPQVQANATDKIYLSSFTPLNDTAYWAGRLDAFLKPLPLTPGGEPDRSVVCDANTQSQCFLWDAGDVQDGHPGDAGYNPGRLLLQAPDATELLMTPPWDPDDLQLGTGANERRVVYSKFGDPSTGNRRMFEYPAPPANPGDPASQEEYDLWDGLGISYIVGDSASETAARDSANHTIALTLVEKQATVDTADPNNPSVIIHSPISYLMGDIFHADPVVLSRPSSFNNYTNDPYLNKPLCGAAADPTRTPPPSYRWFADRNFCRRSILMTSSNDGQLHVFDGGTFGPVGSGSAECLLPAKDLDGDGTSERNEFSLSGFGDDDYDLGDEVSGFKSCATVSDCGGVGACSGGFCTNVKVGVVDGAYDNGTGRELFSFIPRGMMPTVQFMANGAKRDSDFWGMDGTPRVDDVFIDPVLSSGVATCVERQWRTVAIGGYREGGPGYYALDITQPDTLNGDHVPQASGTPAYVPSCFDGTGAGCSRPYPSVLWEFQDTGTVTIASAAVEVHLDEDLNDIADLANSWSRVTTGRIRVCTGACAAADSEDRFVAIFGGGVGNSPSDASGSFIYMVDIETGQTLYKKEIIGAAAGDVGAIDSNSDGYIDRLYVGTVAGFVYKVQLEPNAATPHLLGSQTVQTRVSGTNYNTTVTRIQDPAGDAGKYDPFQVFSTGGKPIYHEISAIFVAEKNRIALAFGTGNRWNLWDATGQEGRFYVLLDNNWSDPDHDGVLDVSCAGCTQPLTESSYTALDPEATFDPANPVYYLYNGGAGGTLPGWYFTLEPNEKVITEGFSLAGVTIFTSFVPTQAVNDDGTCSKAGTSRIFIVGTVTALGYSIPPGGTITDRARYSEISQFTTPPFVERSATANPESGGGSTQHADYITESLGIIRDELKKLQSNRCHYASYTQNIKTIRSDTGVVFVAPIPLCIDPTSWKEF